MLERFAVVWLIVGWGLTVSLAALNLHKLRGTSNVQFTIACALTMVLWPVPLWMNRRLFTQKSKK